jgi:hypothetical protein
MEARMKTLFKAIGEVITVDKDGDTCRVYYGQHGTSATWHQFCFNPDKSYRIVIDGNMVTIKER